MLPYLIIALSCAFICLIASFFLLSTIDKLKRELSETHDRCATQSCSLDSLSKEVAEKTLKLSQLEKQFEALDKKYKDNPSYETQRLLHDLLGDERTLFYIERLPPENVLLRR